MPRRGDASRVRVPEHDRFIRCLKIVEHTYWSGSASVRELAKAVGRLLIATSGTVSTVRRDVARLQSQGLPIVLDPAGNCRVDAVLPGFALRLTKAEGSAVLTWCFRLGRASVSATGACLDSSWSPRGRLRYDRNPATTTPATFSAWVSRGQCVRIDGRV
jgi:hypothetical protein